MRLPANWPRWVALSATIVFAICFAAAAHLACCAGRDARDDDDEFEWYASQAL